MRYFFQLLICPSRLTGEYLECSSRAHRLSAAEEALLAGNDGALECFEFEDIQIYWRALIIKLQSQTYFKQLINVIPIKFKLKFNIIFSLLNGFPMDIVKVSKRIYRLVFCSIFTLNIQNLYDLY